MADFAPNDEPERWEALARYLAGESSAAEAEEVRRWIEESPSTDALVASLDRVLGQVAFTPPSDLDVEAALMRVKGQLDAPDTSDVPAAIEAVELIAPVGEASRGRRGEGPARSRPVPLRRFGARPDAAPSRRWRTLGLAAAAALVLLLGGRYLVSDHGAGGPVIAPAAARSYAASVGARDSVRLADGSLVVLGPASQLTVAEGYGSARREVTLRGEGYFDVQHDDARPFTVRAGGAAIRDVGTVFSVHSDAGASVRVSVREGAVRLQRAASGADSGVVLRAGDVGLVHAGGEVTAQRGAASENDIAWMRGELVFGDATLGDIREDLRRWFGVELVVPDSMLERRFSSTYRGESVDRVLSDIGIALGTHIERRGDTAFVRNGPGASRR